MQEQLEVEKRAAKHGAAAVSIQAPVAQNSGSALFQNSSTGSLLVFAQLVLDTCLVLAGDSANAL